MTVSLSGSVVSSCGSNGVVDCSDVLFGFVGSGGLVVLPPSDGGFATVDTVTEHCALIPVPSLLWQIIVAVPAPTPLTCPVVLTLATEELVLNQTTLLFEALFGKTFAVS